uniref:Rit1 DUSP-like domain-containing protein n=1 Tax=Rhizophora mucronata TaxID=61149 RepID=A0A2P2IXX4_RHIMU
MDRFSILRNLPAAVNFAKLNLSRGNRILICCRSGEDISVCVCLAILNSLFDEEARPSRGNLRQVFGFLTGGRAGLTGRSPSLPSPRIDANLQE